jgi:hypothetical protein
MTEQQTTGRYKGIYCCNRRGRGGEHILDVVPRGTELKPLELRRGIWGGCTHSVIITTTSLWSSSFIQTLSSPFCDALTLQSTKAQGNFCTYIHTCAISTSRNHAWSAYYEKYKQILSYRKGMTDIQVHTIILQKRKKTISINHTTTSINYTTILFMRSLFIWLHNILYTTCFGLLQSLSGVSNHKILWGKNKWNSNFQWQNKILFFKVEIGFIRKYVHIWDIGIVKAQ